MPGQSLFTPPCQQVLNMASVMLEKLVRAKRDLAIKRSKMEKAEVPSIEIDAELDQDRNKITEITEQAIYYASFQCSGAKFKEDLRKEIKGESDRIPMPK
jgi:hypothetical protein